jgi:hypothetical protein
MSAPLQPFDRSPLDGLQLRQMDLDHAVLESGLNGILVDAGRHRDRTVEGAIDLLDEAVLARAWRLALCRQRFVFSGHGSPPVMLCLSL